MLETAFAPDELITAVPLPPSNGRPTALPEGPRPGFVRVRPGVRGRRGGARRRHRDPGPPVFRRPRPPSPGATKTQKDDWWTDGGPEARRAVADVVLAGARGHGPQRLQASPPAPRTGRDPGAGDRTHLSRGGAMQFTTRQPVPVPTGPRARRRQADGSHRRPPSRSAGKAPYSIRIPRGSAECRLWLDCSGRDCEGTHHAHRHRRSPAGARRAAGLHPCQCAAHGARCGEPNPRVAAPPGPEIRHHGQAVAFVVAETLEQARAASVPDPHRLRRRGRPLRSGRCASHRGEARQTTPAAAARAPADTARGRFPGR